MRGNAIPADGLPLRLRCGPVFFSDVTAAEIISDVCRDLGQDQDRKATVPRLFSSLNAHGLHVALEQPRFLRILNESHLCFCDGFGILLLCRLGRFCSPRHRNTPTDFLPALLAELARQGKTVYLLGDSGEVVEAFARWTEERQAGLVVGHHSGFFPFGGEEEERIVAEINRLRPHAVLVGMGNPRQEYWAEANAPRLRCHSLVMIGASMAFLAGKRPRGPRWATDRGLEWLFRLLSEPAKLWRRYLVELPQVAFRLRRYRGTNHSNA